MPVQKNVIIANAKASLKEDIRFILNKMVALSPSSDSDHLKSLISTIYDGLDSKNLVEIAALKAEISSEFATLSKNASKPVVANITNAKVVPDITGKFYVFVTKDGKEEVVYETKDRSAADQKVRDIMGSVIIAEDVEDIETDELEEELEPINSQEEELERYNALNEAAGKLIARIDQAVLEAIDLKSIAFISQIKTLVDRQINTLNKTSVDDDNIDQILSNIENVLHNSETEVENILGRSEPGTTEDNIGDLAETLEEEIVAASEKTDADESVLGDEDIEDIDNSELTEDDDLMDADFDAAEEELTDEEEITDENTDNVDEVIEDGKEDSEEEVVEENDNSAADEINKEIAKLLSLVQLNGDKAQEVADIQDNISENLDILIQESSEEETEELDEPLDDSFDITDEKNDTPESPVDIDDNESSNIAVASRRNSRMRLMSSKKNKAEYYDKLEEANGSILTRKKLTSATANKNKISAAKNKKLK